MLFSLSGVLWRMRSGFAAAARGAMRAGPGREIPNCEGAY